MANSAYGINAGLNSFMNMWGKLAPMRSAIARAGTEDQLDANNAERDAAIDAAKTERTQAIDTNDIRNVMKLNGVDTTGMSEDEASKAYFDMYGDKSKGTGNKDFQAQMDKYGDPDGKFGGRVNYDDMKQAIPQGPQSTPQSDEEYIKSALAERNLPPTFDAYQRARASDNSFDQEMVAGNKGGAIPQDVAKRNADIDALKAQSQAVDAQETDRAGTRIGKAIDVGARKNREAMHEYNKWFDQDKLEKEDEYEMNQRYRSLGKLVSSGDAASMDYLIKFNNMMNPDGQLTANGDGTFTMKNAQGEVVNRAFKPSTQQMGQTLAQIYNMEKFLKTNDTKSFLESKKTMSDIAKNEQAVVASKHGMAAKDTELAQNQQKINNQVEQFGKTFAAGREDAANAYAVRVAQLREQHRHNIKSEANDSARLELARRKARLERAKARGEKATTEATPLGGGEYVVTQKVGDNKGVQLSVMYRDPRTGKESYRPLDDTISKKEWTNYIEDTRKRTKGAAEPFYTRDGRAGVRINIDGKAQDFVGEEAQMRLAQLLEYQGIKQKEADSLLSTLIEADGIAETTTDYSSVDPYAGYEDNDKE